MADELLTRNEFVREMDAREERIRADMDVRDERLCKTLRADMDVRDERLRKTLIAEMDAREERIRNAFIVQTEKLREDIQKAAEGYGATLERIERTVREIHRDGQVKWDLHDYVLKDHAARITKLERGASGG